MKRLTLSLSIVGLVLGASVTGAHAARWQQKAVTPATPIAAKLTKRSRVGAKSEKIARAQPPAPAAGGYRNPLAPDSPMFEYYKRLSADYRTAEKLQWLLKDQRYWQKIETLFGVPSEQQKIVLAMVRDPAMRAGLVRMAQVELDARSASIAAGLKEAKTSGKLVESAQVFDDIYVGGGPADTILTSVAARAGVNRKILTIEELHRYASTFSRLDETGVINSANYGPDRKLVVDRWGEPDSFHGLVELSHVSSVYLPPFRDLGGIAVIDRALTPYPILFKRSVELVEDRALSGDASWPARYRITLNTGEVVYSERIVYATGLGDPRIPKLDAASNSLLENELRLANPNVMHSKTFMAEVGDPTNWTPLSRYLGQEIAVVGGSDSGYMSAKYLFRRALEGGYGYDVSSAGSPKKVHWIGISAQRIRNHIEYGRPWFADLTEHVGDGELVPNAGQLTSVEKLANGRFRLTLNDATTIEVDKIIFATGFKSRLESILRKVVQVDGSLQDSDSVEMVFGRGRKTYGRRQPGGGESGHFGAALRIKGQEIYMAGASVANRVVPKGDPESNDAGSIVYVHNRTAALAKRFLKHPSLHAGEEATFARHSLEAATGSRNFVLASPNAVTTERNLPALDDILLEANLLSTLKRSFILGDGVKTVRLTFSGDRHGALTLRVTGVTEDSASLLKSTIEKNERLMQQVATIVGPGRAQIHQLTIGLVRGPGGLELGRTSIDTIKAGIPELDEPGVATEDVGGLARRGGAGRRR